MNTLNEFALHHPFLLLLSFEFLGLLGILCLTMLSIHLQWKEPRIREGDIMRYHNPKDKVRHHKFVTVFDIAERECIAFVKCDGTTSPIPFHRLRHFPQTVFLP